MTLNFFRRTPSGGKRYDAVTVGVIALLFLSTANLYAEDILPDKSGSMSQPSKEKTYHGTVTKQIPGCETDGMCSVEINTDEVGLETFVWAPPEGFGCSDSPFRQEASKLNPGDHVEIHIFGAMDPCGYESTLKLLKH